jgi:hypothetical protein
LLAVVLFGPWWRVEKVSPWVIAGLTMAHALTLCLVFMPYLDDQPVNAYSSQRGDAYDYVERAQALAADAPLAVAMADRYRMPGYPLYLSAFYRWSADPLRAARITQVLLSSLVLPLAWIIFRSLGLAGLPALLATALPALWPAIYYFDPILIPESLSVVLLAALLAILTFAARGHALLGGVGAAVVIALSTYLKPNHVLLVLPCCAFLACTFGGWRTRAKGGLVMIAVWGLLMTPWFLSQPSGTRALMALTSAQGKNLLQGTGAAVEPTESTLHDRAARALSLPDPEAEALFQRAGDPRPLSNLQAEMGLRLWRARPVATAAYGLTKCGHALGFSGRDLRDVMNAVLTVVSLAAVVWLRRRKVAGAGPWVAYYMVTLAVVLGQAFVFLPNQRFKVVTFDLPALIVIALAAQALWSCRAAAQTWVSGLSPKSYK